MRSRLIQPPYMSMVDNVTVHVFGPECLGNDRFVLDRGIGSAVWTANLLIFIPLILNESLLVAQFFWHNGTAVNGSTDVGIYDEAGTTRIRSSGPTTNAGTSVLQVVDIADFYLPAGKRLWLALGCDSGTQTFFRADVTGNANSLDYWGVKQQAAGWSTGLPSSVTLNTPTVANVPNFGFTGKAVI